MKHCRKPLAVLLALLCVLCCFACCVCVFAEGTDEPEHEHNYVATLVTPATCTEEGLMQYVCSCGAVDTDRDTVIPAKGHRWGPWVTITEATTESEGLMERTCINDPAHKEQKVTEKLEPSPISVFLQKIIARLKAVYDRIISFFYRD